MDPDVVIERADVSDAATILEVQRAAYSSEADLYGDPTIPPMVQTLEDLVAEFGTCTVLRAVSERNIVGSVRAHQSGLTVHIGRLIVWPDWQRRGIGSSLMRAIEAMFPAADRFELFTGHLSEGNLSLYRRLGYHEFKREQAGPHLSIVFLEKLKS